VPDFCKSLQSLSSVMENAVSSGRLTDIAKVARKSSSVARRNYEQLKSKFSGYDVLLQDEYAETMFCFMWDKHPVLPDRRVLVTDYLEFSSGCNLNPISKIVAWYANRMLSKAYDASSVRIFADGVDSLPASQSKRILKIFSIVGPILSEPPPGSKSVLKKIVVSTLFGSGLEDRKLIVLSVGGTSTGKWFVDFISLHHQEISNKLECLIVVLPGPRIDASQYALRLESSIRFLPFNSNVVQYYKAADCVICQAGASTMNEVLSVGTPCVTIPISNHFEQEANAKRFEEMYDFVRLDPDGITVSTLVNAINLALSKKYAAINFSPNATKAVRIILEALRS